MSRSSRESSNTGHHGTSSVLDRNYVNHRVPDSYVISGFVRILCVRIILDHYAAVELSEEKVCVSSYRNLFSGVSKLVQAVMEPKSKAKPSREHSSLTKWYLVFYNLAQVTGYALFHCSNLPV
jgi:hypothetical protein